ncbi:MAG TPA: SigB/SigF/SigG family RNA polymerase sigma factor [Solirubrobacterales bacterium]|jgi:RNA polymerase sigma-B factor
MSAFTIPETRPVGREHELWRRFARSRDAVARAKLIELHMPMARRMASRYAGVSEPFDDLLQVASLGLVSAVDRYDPARGTPFAGFAKPTILGELKRYFRDKVWTVRVPRAVHDMLARVEKATEALEFELHRPPSVGELASQLDAAPSDVLKALEAAHDRRTLSLDAPPGAIDDDESAEEWVGRGDPGYGLVEDRIMLESVLPVLDRQEREILKLRFVDELPQTQIAERLGCSQMHVSRILRRTLDRLREEGRATSRPPGEEDRPVEELVSPA